MAIQFFECPNCRKNLRVGASVCHHCHAVAENDWADPDAATEFADGGYAEEEYEDSHATASNWWRRTIVLVVGLLVLSFFLQLVLLSAEPANHPSVLH